MVLVFLLTGKDRDEVFLYTDLQDKHWNIKDTYIKYQKSEEHFFFITLKDDTYPESFNAVAFIILRNIPKGYFPFYLLKMPLQQKHIEFQDYYLKYFWKLPSLIHWLIFIYLSHFIPFRTTPKKTNPLGPLQYL